MNPRRPQHLLWLACLMGALALSAGLVLAGLSASHASSVGGPPSAPLRPDEALAEPGRFLYQRVKVSGEIVRIVGCRAFALRSRSIRQGLLVVLDDQAIEAGLQLEVGRKVEVAGAVRFLDRHEMQALETRYGLDLTRDRLPIAYGFHAYVLATRVRPAPASS